MKVCHIIPGYYPLRFESPEAYEFVRNLASVGVDVDVIAYGDPEEAISEKVDGVQVMRVPSAKKIRRFSPRNTYNFASDILTWLNDKRYDLIHVYAFRGCALLPILGRELASRWILDVRTGNISLSRLRSNLANRVTSLESLTFDACIAIGKMVGERVLGRGRSFYVVPLGADFEKFKPGRNRTLREQLEIDENQLVIIFAGKLEPQRLQERILYGFKLATEKHSGLRLMIMGNGSMREPLQSLSEKLNIASYVHFTGFIPYSRIQDYMTAGDIGLAYTPIIPPQDPQPLLKTVESLACGLPTIATNTRGNAVFIQHGENGLLVNDDPRSLSEGFLRLAQDSALRQELARRARPSVAQYDWQRIVEDQLLPVYEQVLA